MREGRRLRVYEVGVVAAVGVESGEESESVGKAGRGCVGAARWGGEAGSKWLRRSAGGCGHGDGVGGEGRERGSGAREGVEEVCVARGSGARWSLVWAAVEEWGR